MLHKQLIRVAKNPDGTWAFSDDELASSSLHGLNFSLLEDLGTEVVLRVFATDNVNLSNVRFSAVNFTNAVSRIGSMTRFRALVVSHPSDASRPSGFKNLALDVEEKS